jgi:hypothetical protein
VKTASILAVIGAALGIALGTTSAMHDLGLIMAEQPILPLKKGTGRLPINPTAPQPKVQIDNETYKFGKMEVNSVLAHDFIFSNVGESDLRLSVGESSCKCTVGNLEKQVLKPGESTRVTLSWEAKMAPGPFRQSAKIHTNDMSRPLIEIFVDGEIAQSLEAVPQEFNLGQFAVEDGSAATLKIYGFSDEPIKLLDHQFSNKSGADHFELTTEELKPSEIRDEDAKSGLVVRLTAKPGLPLGVVRQSVVLTTNLQNLAPLELKVNGLAVSDITLQGASQWDSKRSVLKVGSVPAEKGFEHTIYVMVRGQYAEETTVEVAEVDPAELSVTVGAGEDIQGVRVKRIPITITLKPNSKPINRLGSSDDDPLARIRLESNHPKVKEIPILVQFGVEG